jgi:DNA repair exonuclease SbcCD ATPase subunit
MAAAVSIEPRIRTLAVIGDPVLWHRNRMEEKLAKRGLQVVRTAKSSSEPHALHDVALVVCQLSGTMQSQQAKWKGAADKHGARFFGLTHEMGRPCWVALDEWVGRAIVADAPVSDAALLEVAENELRDERAARLRAEATVEELRSSMADDAKELRSLRSTAQTHQSELASALSEIEGLKASRDAEKERANRLGTHYAGHEKRVTELKSALEGVIAARDREIEELRGKVAVAQRVSERKAALEVEVEELRAKAPRLAVDFVFPTDAARTFAGRLADLVHEGLLEPDEARAKYLSKHGGGQ